MNLFDSYSQRMPVDESCNENSTEVDDLQVSFLQVDVLPVRVLRGRALVLLQREDLYQNYAQYIWACLDADGTPPSPDNSR